MNNGKKSEEIRMDTPLNPEFKLNERIRNTSQVYVPGESLEEQHAVEEANEFISEKIIGQTIENG